MVVELPEDCIKAMLSVYYGRFIFDPCVANRLRYVQIHRPDLIEIGEPSVILHWKIRPIFAAILTSEGKEYVDAL